MIESVIALHVEGVHMKEYLIIAAIVIGLIAGAYIFGRHDGRALERDSTAEAMAKHVANENALLEGLQNANAERKVVFRDRVKVIQQAEDDWYSQPLPADLAGRLRGEVRP